MGEQQEICELVRMDGYIHAYIYRSLSFFYIKTTEMDFDETLE